jgi:hypothetical protein
MKKRLMMMRNDCEAYLLMMRKILQLDYVCVYHCWDAWELEEERKAQPFQFLWVMPMLMAQ